MYLDTGGWRGPLPERPRRARLTARQERAALWIAVGVVLLALLSPIAGVTMLDAVVATARH